MDRISERHSRTPWFNQDSIPGRFTADILAGSKEPLVISHYRLEQIVSLTPNDQPVSLLDFILSEAPDCARTLGLEPLAISQQIPTIDELDIERLRRVTVLDLSQREKGTGRLMPGDLSEDDVIREIETDSLIGNSILEAWKYDKAQIEVFALNNKLRLKSDR